MGNSHVTVTFDERESSEILDLSLDDKKLTEVYKEEGKIKFAPGETAYLKLLRSSDESYEIYTSAGVASRSARNLMYPMSEDVVFPATKYGELDHAPNGGVDWVWMGKNAGDPLFNGRNIRLNLRYEGAVPVGILRCEYETKGDRLKLRVESDDMGDFDVMDVLVVVVQGENIEYTQVTYDTEEGGDPIPVNLLVKDFCSDDNVDEVEVYLDGSYVGKTNMDGKIYLGELVPRSLHDLKMTKSGYIDSDLDVLHNDSFTVPSG